MQTAAYILTILGSVGLFLYGMKTMSEALQRLSGGSLRRALRAMTLSPLRGVLSGTAVTGVVQSSGAVTVMITGFVNAGLLGLKQAVAMIMGANIGTTVTTWLVALCGLSPDPGFAAVPLFALAFPLLVLGRGRAKHVGGALAGLALLLLAVGILGRSLGPLTENRSVIGLLNGLAACPGASLWFVAAGALLTALVQSSSAMTVFTIVLCGTGLVPFECALAMVLGENLGTTVTANLAAVVTDSSAKRAALSHLLFNLIGVLWALPLLPLLARGEAWLIVAFGGASPLFSAASRPLAIALFHTLFNVANTLLLFGFIPQLAALTGFLVRPRRAKKASSGRRPVLPPVVPADALALYQFHSQILRYLREAREIYAAVRRYFRETDPTAADGLLRRAEHSAERERARRKELDALLSDGLGRASSQDGVRELQRIGDTAAEAGRSIELSLAVVRALERKRRAGIWFTPGQRECLSALLDRIERPFALAVRRAEQSGETPGGIPPCTVPEELSGCTDGQREPVSDPEATPGANAVFADLIVAVRRLDRSARQLAELAAPETGLPDKNDK